MSKKLEGNGRWESSRMMLPEHREQYLERRRVKSGAVQRGERAVRTARAQMPTREELEWIRDYALLPMMLTIVDKNCTQIELADYSLKRLYVRSSHVLMQRITDDLTRVRRSLKNSGIKVFEDELIDSVGVYYRFICRGYEDRFALMRDVVRSEVSVRITRYVEQMFR